MTAFWFGFWATAGFVAFSTIALIVTTLLVWLVSRRG